MVQGSRTSQNCLEAGDRRSSDPSRPDEPAERKVDRGGRPRFPSHRTARVRGRLRSRRGRAPRGVLCSDVRPPRGCVWARLLWDGEEKKDSQGDGETGRSDGPDLREHRRPPVPCAALRAPSALLPSLTSPSPRLPVNPSSACSSRFQSSRARCVLRQPLTRAVPIATALRDPGQE